MKRVQVDGLALNDRQGYPPISSHADLPPTFHIYRPYPVAVRPSSALPPASLNESAKPCRVASVTNTRKEEHGREMHVPPHSSRDYRPRSQKVPEALCDQYAVQLQSKCNALHGNVACLVALDCPIEYKGVT